MNIIEVLKQAIESGKPVTIEMDAGEFTCTGVEAQEIWNELAPGETFEIK